MQNRFPSGSATTTNSGSVGLSPPRVLECGHARCGDAFGVLWSARRQGRSALADRLDLPFVDRAIPTAAAARHLDLPADGAESLDEHAPSRWERIAADSSARPRRSSLSRFRLRCPSRPSGSGQRQQPRFRTWPTPPELSSWAGREWLCSAAGPTCCACVLTARWRRGSLRWLRKVSTRRLPDRDSDKWTEPERRTPKYFLTSAKMTLAYITSFLTALSFPWRPASTSSSEQPRTASVLPTPRANTSDLSRSSAGSRWPDIGACVRVPLK